MADPTERRSHQVARLKERLLQRGNPRLLMFLLLTLAGLIGFLSSFSMHSAGLTSMGLRYMLAITIAYLSFLGLLGIWLFATRSRRSESPGLIISRDTIDVALYADPSVNIGPVVTPTVSETVAESTAPSVAGGASKGIGKLSLGDADGEGVIIIVVLLVIVAILAAVLASFWVLIEAPLLLAELLVDGALVAGMAKRLTANAGQHWALTALRRTWAPFLITFFAFGIVGFALEHFVPGATTMVEAVANAGR